MSADDGPGDLPTVAALGVIAMCIATFDHEALGHGGACMAMGGRIELLTSALFRCDLHSPLIAAAGPASNFAIGTLALLVSAITPLRAPALRLVLLLIGLFAWFWEGGYLVQAMAAQNGDLYFAARDLAVAPDTALRLVGAVLGVLVYIAAIRIAASSLRRLRPDPRAARSLARTAWVAASAGAVVAALFYRSGGFQDIHDAFFEIGVAALPLLVLPRRPGEAAPTPAIKRRWPLIAFATVLFALFAMTLGRGLGAS